MIKVAGKDCRLFESPPIALLSEIRKIFGCRIKDDGAERLVNRELFKGDTGIVSDFRMIIGKQFQESSRVPFTSSVLQATNRDLPQARIPVPTQRIKFVVQQFQVEVSEAFA